MTRQLDLTVQGVLGTNPVLSRTGEAARAYCRFRVAVTPSYRSDRGWQNSETMWFTAKAWGTLAENLSLSLHKGDPVLLTGRLSEETWSTDAGTRSTNVITLQSAGHDLTRGESRFMRVRTADSAGSAKAAGPTETVPSVGSRDIPRVSSVSSVDSASVLAPAPGGEETEVLPSEHWETGDCLAEGGDIC